VKRAFAFLVVLAAVVAACAGHKAGRTKLADGSYQLACRTPLADCLGDLTDVCNAHGYDIVRAKETRSRNGVEPVDSEFIESEAVVRCRAASTIFGSSPAPAASSPAPAAAGAAPRCFPGATQACFGPAACQGAQICTSDGSMFGPCDCGVHATPLAGEADAGPPPTWAVPTGDGGAP
jgi:hypothetical protein